MRDPSGGPGTKYQVPGTKYREGDRAPHTPSSRLVPTTAKNRRVHGDSWTPAARMLAIAGATPLFASHPSDTMDEDAVDEVPEEDR